MVDNKTGQVFYVKNVIKKSATQGLTSDFNTGINDQDIEEIAEERNAQPRGSLKLRDLGWSRQIVEQFLVTDTFERRSTVFYEFC